MKIHTSSMPDEDEKYEKSLADIKREQVEAEKRQQELIKQRIEQQRKARKEKLDKDRIEMLKQKQGISPMPTKEVVVAEKLTGKKALENLWFHYNMYIILGVIFAIIATFFVVNIIKKPKADLNIMVMVEEGFSIQNEALQELFSEYTADVNNDKKKIVSIMNCPIGSNKLEANADPAYFTKFYGELQAGETMLYISNDESDKTLLPETIMYDLTKKYPDNPKVTKIGFKLTGDKLKKALDWEEMPQDTYIGIRNPEKISGQTQEQAKIQFEQAMIFMENLIKEFS